MWIGGRGAVCSPEQEEECEDEEGGDAFDAEVAVADADVDDAGAVEADELGHELFGRGDAERAGLRLGGVVGGLLRVVGVGRVEGARRVEGLRSRGGGLRRMDVVGGRLRVVGGGRVESARGVGCGLRRVDVVGGLLRVVNGGGLSGRGAEEWTLRPPNKCLRREG